MDLLQTDTFVSLSGDIDQLFHLYDRFPLFPEIKVMPVQPVINILLQRDHGILEKFWPVPPEPRLYRYYTVRLSLPDCAQRNVARTLSRRGRQQRLSPQRKEEIKKVKE